MPHLVRSAIYRFPTSLKDLLIWMVVREPAAAVYFCRQFYWSTINLNVEELPPKSLLILNGKDRFIDAPAVLHWLKSLASQRSRREDRVKVLYQPEGTHGGLLLNSSWMDESVSAMLSMLREG